MAAGTDHIEECVDPKDSLDILEDKRLLLLTSN
jgi:hypothetical protein